MNRHGFEARIDELFHLTRLSTPEGRVRVPEKPVDPFEVFKFAAEDDEERRLLGVSVLGVLDVVEHEYATQNLFTFQWDDGGRMGWECYLTALVLGGGGHLAYYSSEGHPLEFFALIEGGTSPGIWSRFALDLLGSGGSSYGVPMFDRLPPGLRNHRADLMEAAFVKEGCRRFLDGREEKRRGPARGWRHLRDELIGRALEPRSFSGYKPLPEHDPEGAPESELTQEERKLILDNYFDLAYREWIGGPWRPRSPVSYEDEEEDGEVEG